MCIHAVSYEVVLIVEYYLDVVVMASGHQEKNTKKMSAEIDLPWSSKAHFWAAWYACEFSVTMGQWWTAKIIR